MNIIYKILLSLSLLCFLSVCGLLVLGYTATVIGPLVISMFVCLAVGVRGTNTLFKSFAFSIWIFASVSFAMFYPDMVTTVGGFNTAVLIVPLIQLIMFGMGTQLSLKDFAGVLKKPKGVLVGILCQFTIMPLVSMVGIAVIITVITAAGRDSLVAIGLLLILAAVLHNALGYLFGYWGGRILGMDENSCRTIALEVGMQNGGVASGLAAEMGKIATVGLAPAVFGPWMNISGSTLANWWRRKALKAEKTETETIAENETGKADVI